MKNKIILAGKATEDLKTGDACVLSITPDGNTIVSRASVSDILEVYDQSSSLSKIKSLAKKLVHTIRSKRFKKIS